jgi:hypothetical protein
MHCPYFFLSNEIGVCATMLKRPMIIGIAVLVAVVGLALFFTYRVPPGVAPKGGSAETIAWLGLAAAVASMLTAIIGLIQRILELRASGQGE